MTINRCILLLLTACLASCTSVPEVPVSGATLADCGVLPNCVTTSPAASDKAVAPLQATAQQWQQLKQWIATQPDWRITTETDDYLQAVVTSPLMRFRDDIQLRYDSDASVIQVRSSSRLGVSDMGVNRKRVEMLRAQVAGSSS